MRPTIRSAWTGLIETVMERAGWVRRERHEMVVYLLESELTELDKECSDLRRNYAALQASVDVAGLALAKMRQVN